MEAFFYFLLYIFETRAFPLGFLRENSAFDTLYLMVSPALALVLLIVAASVFVNKGKNLKNLNLLLPLILYTIIIIITEILSSQGLREYVGHLYPSLGLCSLFIIISQKPIVLRKFIKIAAYAYFCVGVVHLLDTLAASEGVEFWLGGKNYVFFLMTIALLYNGLNYYINGKRIIFIAFLAIYYATQLLVFSGTAVIAAAVFTGFLFIPGLGKLTKKIDLFKMSAIFLLLLVIFFVTGMTVLESSFVADNLESILGKSATLTDRTPIWLFALDNILRAPFTGYGHNINPMLYFGASSAHNQYLQTVFDNGVFALLAIFYLIYCLSKKLKESKNNDTVRFIISIIIGMMVGLIAESPQFEFLIEIMIVGFAVCMLPQKKQPIINPKRKIDFTNRVINTNSPHIIFS